MRSRYEEQLQLLNKELITMGAYCENAIASVGKALLDGDLALASKVIDLDPKIDQKEKDIETMCLKLLLQQQPVARDLRTISSALKMVTDMERIGDQAADIAEIVTMAKIQPGDALSLGQMARETIKMVTDSIEAFVNADLELARAVIRYDDVVDDLFSKVRHELIEIIKGGIENAEYIVDLLMIAKYFERIGDHATNIGEWVVYSITGERPERNAQS